MANDVERLYDTDLTDAGWALVAPLLPPARPGGRPRTTNIRAVLNAIFLSTPNRLSVAVASPGVPGMERRLSLLPKVGERRYLGLHSALCV